MKFGAHFEYHKIPEWYNMYFDYEFLKEVIGLFKVDCNKGECMKLQKDYYFAIEPNTNQWNLFAEDPFTIWDHD